LSPRGGGFPPRSLKARDRDKLAIVKTDNAGNPLTAHMKPLLVIDVWEHAFTAHSQASENEAPIRQANDQTEAPEEFAVDDEEE
jgi:superoxide dismutase